MCNSLVCVWISVFPLFFIQDSLTDDFELVKEEDSITLYERWIMYNGERVRELKANFTVEDATTDELEMLLKNDSEGTRWNRHAGIYEVIPGETPLTWQVYVQYDMPWPLKDMDCNLAYRVEKNPDNGGETIISFNETENSRYPVSSEFNRITGTEGKWIVRPQEDGLAVTYLIKTDRSSEIPGWVSDPIVHKNLFKTISYFKNILEEH